MAKKNVVDNVVDNPTPTTLPPPPAEFVEVTLPDKPTRNARNRQPLIEWGSMAPGQEVIVDITDMREIATRDNRTATIVRCVMVEPYGVFAKGQKVSFFAPAVLKRLLSNVAGGMVKIRYLGKVEIDSEITSHDFKLFATPKDMLQPPPY